MGFTEGFNVEQRQQLADNKGKTTFDVEGETAITVTPSSSFDVEGETAITVTPSSSFSIA